MDITIYLARIIGISFIFLYGGFLLNNKYYFKHLDSLVKHPFLILMSGLLSLVLGLIILQFHSAWTADWRSLITFVAWLLVLSGIIRLLFPKYVLKIFDAIHSKISLINILTTIFFFIGVYLTYKGLPVGL